MPHYAGSAVQLEFVDNTGTVTISGDQRQVSWNEQQNIIDTTAGSDGAASHVSSFRKIDGSFGLINDGASGSAIYDNIYVGAQGTLRIEPFGDGNELYAVLTTITQRQDSAPFDGVQEITVNWEADGDWISHPYRP